MHFKEKAILFFSLLILSTALLIVIPPTSLAQTILFQDDFEDGNSNGWDVVGNPGWSVANGQYGIHLDPGVSNSVPSDNLWDESWNQYLFEVDLRGVSGTDKNLVFRFVDNLNFYSLHHTGGYLNFSKYINNLEYRFANPIYYPLENGPTYHFEIEVDEDNLKVYVNNQPLFDVVDNIGPKIQGGKIGLRAGTGAVHPTEVWFDNVVVRSLLPELPNLGVPDIKQYSSPWNNLVYDHANLWSMYPTIEIWGCALTSASMVLKYHGHSSANPGTLNEWLKTQSDGYLRNGLLNWLSISRYTHINDSPTSPTLLYRRLTASNTNLINELTQNRPAILKQPGHYVVAKSQLPDTFGINDPAYADRTTLLPYENSFSAIGSYQPTHSNLSYVLLVIDPDITLKVFGPGGSEIQSLFFIDEPLTNDSGSPETRGQPLATFLLPEPPGGTYKVEASGPNNTYSLDSYLYNENGEANQSSFIGLISEGQKDEFIISIGESSEIIQEVTIDTILQDLDSAWLQRLIRNRGFYWTLKSELTITKRFLFTGKNRLAKRILKNVLRKVRRASPRVLNHTVSNILQDNLEILIDSL